MTALTSRPIRLLLVEPSEIVRRGLKSALIDELHGMIQLVGEASTSAEALVLWQRMTPDVIIVGLLAADGRDLAICREISAQIPQPRIIGLTSAASDSATFAAVSAGVSGFIDARTPISQLSQTVRDVAAGKSILDPNFLAQVLRVLRQSNGLERALKRSSLSRQELRVLSCVAEGLTNKQTGGYLGLSENTVKNYLMSVFEKLGVKRRSQAAAWFAQIKNTPS